MNEATLRKMGERHDYVRRTLALLEAIEAAGEAGVGDETALRVMGAEASGIRGVTGRLAHARWAAEALGRPWPEPWARVKEDGATRWRAGAGTAPARRILESYLARAGEHAHLPLGHPDAGEATAGGPTLVLGAIERCTERVRQAGSFAGARALVVALDRMGGGLWEERTLTGVHIARVEGAEHAIEPWCARGNRLGQLRATGDAWERSHRVGGEDEPAQVRLCRARRVERRVPAGDVGAQMLRAVGQIKLGDNAGWQARRDARPTVYADLGRTRTGGRYGEGEWLRPPEDIAAERVWVVRTLDEAGRERACEATYLRNEVPSAGGLARDGYVAAGETVVAITTRADEDGAPPPARAQRPAAPDWSLRTPLEGGTSLLYLEYRAADLAFVREDATTGEAAAQATAALARAAARHDLRTVLGLDEPERGYFPHLQGLAERGLLEPGDPSEIREGLEEDFALRRGHRRAAKPAPAATHERRHDAPVQDAAMRALAERHQLRWIAERRQGARGPGGGGCWASAIEAELEGLAEVMGAAPRTLGLGRRLALVLGPRGRGQTLVEWNGDTAVAHLTPGAAGGSDLARAWARALRVALDAQASNDERAMLDAFDAALERERPEGEDPQAWVEHTFEAFVEAEGRLRGAGTSPPPPGTGRRRKPAGRARSATPPRARRARARAGCGARCARRSSGTRTGAGSSARRTRSSARRRTGRPTTSARSGRRPSWRACRREASPTRGRRGSGSPRSPRSGPGARAHGS